MINLKINIDEILKQQSKSRYWLAKEIKVSYPTIKTLCDNKTEGTKFETIENICKALNCTPNDILILTN